MNKVLIICTNFLPVRNGGTIRCEKLVKYLPYYNWNSIILTKSNNLTNNNFDIINNTKVFRSRKFDLISFLYNIKIYLSHFFNDTKKSNSLKKTLNKTKSVKRRISEYFIIPDVDIFWALGAFFKGILIFKKEKPDVILSSGPNHSTHILGLFLKKFFGAYWVVEFRDPWTTNPFRIEKPSKILIYLDNYLEKIVLKNSDRINVTSIEYKNQFLKKYNFLNGDKIVNIPNGFDPEDFEISSSTKNEVLTIVHSGNFYSHRSSVHFINAVIYLIENNLIFENEILIKFIGELDNAGKDLIISSGFENSFCVTGTVNFNKSIMEIKNADMLLLIPGPGAGTIPGKFYEYLAAQKPIFCISNEGPPKKIINDYDLGIVSNDFDIINIANNLNNLILRIKNNNFAYPDTTDLLNKFNRKYIAKNMASIFNKCFD